MIGDGTARGRASRCGETAAEKYAARCAPVGRSRCGWTRPPWRLAASCFEEWPAEW